MNNSIKVIKVAYKKFDKALEKELNTLGIDPEKLLQAFYIFIGDIKYTLRVAKSVDKYLYTISLLAPEKKTPCYIAYMVFDVVTGDTKITKVYLNNVGIND